MSALDDIDYNSLRIEMSIFTDEDYNSLRIVIASNNCNGGDYNS